VLSARESEVGGRRGKVVLDEIRPVEPKLSTTRSSFLANTAEESDRSDLRKRIGEQTRSLRAERACVNSHLEC
jgi:hypothetical protein